MAIIAERQNYRLFIKTSTFEFPCLSAEKARSFNIKNSIRDKLWR
jgi:hypothetical protein